MLVLFGPINISLIYSLYFSLLLLLSFFLLIIVVAFLKYIFIVVYHTILNICNSFLTGTMPLFSPSFNLFFILCQSASLKYKSVHFIPLLCLQGVPDILHAPQMRLSHEEIRDVASMVVPHAERPRFRDLLFQLTSIANFLEKSK